VATAEGLIAAVDQVIAFFNAKKMDLPDGFFDRKTQFVLNGAPFETLLGQSPTDPLILMLARGPAGFRFTAKALQHALPDARIDRPSTPLTQHVESASLRPRGLITVTTQLRLSGTLRGTGETINSVVSVTLRLTEGGQVQVAEAELDAAALDKIREARLRP
jgi:hypothetical protein